jgi:hypothetical protein
MTAAMSHHPIFEETPMPVPSPQTRTVYSSHRVTVRDWGLACFLNTRNHAILGSSVDDRGRLVVYFAPSALADLAAYEQARQHLEAIRERTRNAHQRAHANEAAR